MHDTYAPIEDITDVDPALTHAVFHVIDNNAHDGRGHETLTSLLLWHYKANPDNTYYRAIEAGLLELANAIRLQSIVNNDGTNYETISTGSDYHDQLLIELDIYAEDEHWAHDFYPYRHITWNGAPVDLGLPYTYHRDHVRYAHRIHRVTKTYADNPFDGEFYQAQGVLEVLGTHEYTDTYEDADFDAICEQLNDKKEHVTLDWLADLQETYWREDESLLAWFERHNVLIPLYKRAPNHEYISDLRNLIDTIPVLADEAALRFVTYYYDLRETCDHAETVRAFRHSAFTAEQYAELLNMPADYVDGLEDTEWWTRI